LLSAIRLCFCVGLFGEAFAHESQPGLLELKQLNTNRYEVLWRAPIYYGKPHPSNCSCRRTGRGSVSGRFDNCPIRPCIANLKRRNGTFAFVEATIHTSAVISAGMPAKSVWSGFQQFHWPEGQRAGC
jgi:hypothetical protein